MFTFATQAYWQSNVNRCTLGDAGRKLFAQILQRLSICMRNENAFLLRKMGVNLPKLELVISEWEARK